MSNPFEIIDNRLRNIELLLLDIKHPEPQSVEYGYLKTPDAANYLNMTPNALRQYVFKGEIASIKRGNSLYFKEIDLVEWLEIGRRKTKV